MIPSLRIKLDENLGNRGAAMLRAAGHDVATVFEEGLTSASDHKVSEACRTEKRCLVTLDRDFANPFLFDPAEFSGIAVLRLPVDLLVYRPADVERRYTEGDPLIREALDHGKVLYAERNR